MALTSLIISIDVHRTLVRLFNRNGPFEYIHCEEEISFAVDTIDLSEWGNTGISAKTPINGVID